MSLYDGSVPVFLHYLDRARVLLRRTRGRPDLLDARLAPNMSGAAQQFASAAGFALRGTFPLAGLKVPDFPAAAMDYDGLNGRITFAQDNLRGLDRDAFDPTRRVTHIAGFAELDQDAAEYLDLFAKPNFFFHLSMGFAVLRQSGLDVGKADFDGLHDYPPGFRF